MKQAIAGVAPPNLGEVTVMTVWPSVASTSLGRTLGRFYSLRAGVGNVLTIGNLIALAAIPAAIVLYAYCKLSRYRLTNRRVLVEALPRQRLVRWTMLDEFDEIEVVVLPGQDWYPAGELIFRKGTLETLRLSGVPRPETFRQTCLKAQRAYVGVKRALEQQIA